MANILKKLSSLILISSSLLVSAASADNEANRDVVPPTEIAESRFLSVNEIPAHLSSWLYFEQIVNNRFTGTIFAPLDHSDLDQRFDPFNRPVVLMGYLEIPRAQADIKIDEAMLPASARRVLLFEKDGVPYVRMFIHPLMEDAYDDEAKLWGEKYVDANGKTKYRLKYGDFVATLSSSMRSWVVWNRARPQEFIGQKTSIAVTIGIDRKNDIDKLERAFAITQLTKEILRQDRNKYHFDMFMEPAIQNTAKAKGGKHYGNITRVFLPTAHSNGNTRYLPGFSLTSTGPNGEKPLLLGMIERSGMKPEDFIQQKMIDPLIQSYAFLTYKHGIVGEPHQQNVLFELNPDGELTGRVFYRDLDAFKPDIELRHVRGLSDEPFLDVARPSKLLKINKAQKDHHRSYQSYVKGAWTEAIEEMMRKAGDPEFGQRVGLAERFDKALLTEIVQHFGTMAVFDAGDMAAHEEFDRMEYQRDNKLPGYSAEALAEIKKRAKIGTLNNFVANHRAQLEALMPEVQWDRRPLMLLKAQAAKLIENFSVNQLFGRNYANTATTYIFDINVIVEKFKDMNVPKIQPGVSQEVLRAEYERLVFNYRGTAADVVPRKGYFILNKGSITAVNSVGDVIGHAFLEPRSALDTEKHYNVKYPRVEPNRAVLRMLYDFADGKITEIPSVETLRYVYPVEAKVVRSCQAIFGGR